MTEPSALATYQEWIHAKFLVVNPTQDVITRLAICGLGIVGEVGEFLLAESDEARLLELGDALSYVMYASALLDYDVSTWLSDDEMESPELVMASYGRQRTPDRGRTVLLFAAAFSEAVKKRVAHGRAIRPSFGVQHLRAITQHLAVLAAEEKLRASAVILANTSKVESRYPAAPGPDLELEPGSR